MSGSRIFVDMQPGRRKPWWHELAAWVVIAGMMFVVRRSIGFEEAVLFGIASTYAKVCYHRRS